MAGDPRILAIETSSRAGSVAAGLGGKLLAVEAFRTDHNHAIELMPTISRLCATQHWQPGDLDELYVSIGPGSFTGLRIAATVGRTLARFTGVRVVAVSTVAVLAHNALDLPHPPDQIGVVLDARRRQVYAASFERRDDHYIEQRPPRVRDPASFVAELSHPRAVLGEGLPYHKEALDGIEHEVLPETLWRPRAEWVLRLGWEEARRGRFSAAAELVPLYLRIPEAEEVWNRRHRPA